LEATRCVSHNPNPLVLVVNPTVGPRGSVELRPCECVQTFEFGDVWFGE
jgi:hypothetical protein